MFESYSHSTIEMIITRGNFHKAMASLESMMDWIASERSPYPHGSDALAEEKARLDEMRAKVKTFIEEIEDWVS